MDYILDMLKLYSSDGLIIALYTLSWLIIFFLDHNKNRKVTFLYSAWYLPAFLLNPLIGSILEYFEILTLRMVRVYWLLPIVFVIAYACTLLVRREWSNKLYNDKIMCIILILFIVLTGIPVLSKTNFTKAENIYKLPNGVIQVCNIIKEHIESENNEISRIAMPIELSIYARQYDGGLYLLYGRYPDEGAAKEAIEVYELMKVQSLDVERIVNNCKMEKCNYIVLDTSKIWDTQLSMENMKEIGQYDKYCVFYLNEIR